ncbi:leucine-rich repeat-containing protein 40 [Nannizzia gypsea CBS 118893]|uniref:Leucine-rich repeat-containing protein 40 n=1 Tax=Arthroderma gypseum (strain ATCC MYA-4604 / CBS 118893) TaxID=535722 RepID=E4V2T9_ARTGP|nr:leucine-rich repeat-containing protein 40 [Nannizzia gypsea CBS 118893]EFR04313.1 leucine-rich repeat-containing protein 40 [Nannizzia gypsea CBS 118893]
MDNKTAASGRPRLSRLPLPTGTPSRSLRPSPSRDRLQADAGLKISRLRRPSEDIFNRPYSPACSSESDPLDGHHENSNATSTATTPLRPQSFSKQYHLNESLLDPADTRQGRSPSRNGPRPSLSDRTIETLAQIPGSPSPGRRKSGFVGELRRSSSRQSLNGTPLSPAPSARNARMPRSPSAASTSRERPVGQRSVSMYIRSPAASIRNGMLKTSEEGIEETETSMLPPHKPVSAAATRQPMKSQSMISRKPRTMPPLGQVFGEAPDSEPTGIIEPLSIPKTRKPPSTISSNFTSPTSTTSKRSPRTSITSDGYTANDVPPKEPEPKKTAKSSSALRESIAKAKAARKAAQQQQQQQQEQQQREPSCKSPDTLEEDNLKDPFNQLSGMEPTSAALQSRTASARKSGLLNISAMGLAAIPDEVMTMYTFDPNSNDVWYENVDLVKFMAADNELTSLPDEAFPDVDLTEFNPDEPAPNAQFGGLEHIDLHGNKLFCLPTGLRRLQRLRTLNLSKNKLDSMDALDVVFSIRSLTELKLAENNLSGMLTSDIRRLVKLEVLDLHGNCLTGLPDSIADLTALRILNVSENRLPSLPLMVMKDLPLTELNAWKNRLDGHFFPKSFKRHDTLQVLNVATNNLDELSAEDTIELPNLQQLFIEQNCLKAIPNISSWKSLLSIIASENRLSALPEGLADLANIKHLDFTTNDIRLIDDNIGSMESLVTLRISNNPLREKKFLSMDTDDLKRELNSRREVKEPSQDEEEGSVQTEFTLAPESPTATITHAWRVKQRGVLDRSSTNLSDLEPMDIEPLIAKSDIRCLYLQRNRLEKFPVPALSLVAHSLIDLDLSNNPIGRTELSTPISLPNLQNLTLSSSALTSLEPLLANLSAPSLSFLDVSINRLKGPVPVMRATYPNLVTFLASENAFDSLSYEAVEGLQVLDVANNDIDALPPRAGLLGVDDVPPGMNALRRFEVAGNRFRVPRWQIVSKGTEAILDHLKNRISEAEMKEWKTSE